MSVEKSPETLVCFSIKANRSFSRMQVICWVNEYFSQSIESRALIAEVFRVCHDK